MEDLACKLHLSALFLSLNQRRIAWDDSTIRMKAIKKQTEANMSFSWF